MDTHAPRAVPTVEPAASPVMTMLSDHLPLTLLLDLALGVRSSELYEAEAPDLSWLSSRAVSRAG